MHRAILAIVVTLILALGAVPALAQQDAEEPSPPGGFGNTRGDLNRAFGDEEATTAIEDDGYAFYPVGYPNSEVFFIAAGADVSLDDRAYIIARYPPETGGWDIVEAVTEAYGMLPADATPTSGLEPFTAGSQIQGFQQSFHSDAIARLIPQPAVYDGAERGAFVLILRIRPQSTFEQPRFMRVVAALGTPEPSHTFGIPGPLVRPPAAPAAPATPVAP